MWNGERCSSRNRSNSSSSGGSGSGSRGSSSGGFQTKGGKLSRVAVRERRIDEGDAVDDAHNPTTTSLLEGRFLTKSKRERVTVKTLDRSKVKVLFRDVHNGKVETNENSVGDVYGQRENAWKVGIAASSTSRPLERSYTVATSIVGTEKNEDKGVGIYDQEINVTSVCGQQQHQQHQ
ncbi:hypothetical protein HZH68_013319 [Vespula germanica]|uniref:Uncharacterized protein n=1 Tax=Vespula germanica TaxID=30212 RepID=A0A834JFH4_VESGE|nr:hypothetical protein HZH68_013319 [Vespula germanica]